MSHNSLEQPCFECENGLCHEVHDPYVVNLPDGDSFTIASLPVLRCEACGEISIPAASAKMIDAAVEEYSDTLSVEFLQRFLTQFRLDQTEAAEALGLGTKTFHRWIRGSQRISRSMGYFLRVLMAHPAAFEWLQERSWKGSSETQRKLRQSFAIEEVVIERLPQ